MAAGLAFDGAFVAEGGEVGGVGGGGCKVEEALADGAEVTGDEIGDGIILMTSPIRAAQLITF